MKDDAFHETIGGVGVFDPYALDSGKAEWEQMFIELLILIWSPLARVSYRICKRGVGGFQ
jgi:hypothetical protein